VSRALTDADAARDVVQAAVRLARDAQQDLPVVREQLGRYGRQDSTNPYFRF
jgi:hypothetical protein